MIARLELNKNIWVKPKFRILKFEIQNFGFLNLKHKCSYFKIRNSRFLDSPDVSLIYTPNVFRVQNIYFTKILQVQID